MKSASLSCALGALALFASIVCASTAQADAVPYLGGPVVSSAKIFMINWNSDVPSAVQTGMPAFYADIVQSDYWSVLAQYTDAANQHIGAGSYLGATTLTGTLCPAGGGDCGLDDISIIGTIGARINANDAAFPPLATDAAGNLDTIFMVHFPPDMQIRLSGLISCVDFGAVYEDFQADAMHGNLVVPIGIVPDCTGFDETIFASSVLADITTDPRYIDLPAWIDNMNRGIGFICSSVEPAVAVTAQGHTYNVSKVWSNNSNVCVSGDRIFVAGFEVN